MVLVDMIFEIIVMSCYGGGGAGLVELVVVLGLWLKWSQF